MKRVACLIVGIILCCCVAQAEVTVSKIFGDHMVLQRDTEVPVWGWADPGEAVTIEFGGQKKTAKADKTGKWMVRLAPMEASGEGRSLVVGGEAPGITFTNVLVGDVWLCSGQSNMSMQMKGCARLLQEAMDTAEFPLIRHVTIGGGWSVTKATDLEGTPAWTVCTPQSVGGFSAVGFFFGRTLHQEIGVPIGLITSAVGGTRIEPWTPAEGFALVPELASLLEQAAGAEELYRRKMGTAVSGVRKWVADTEKALETGGELFMPPVLPSHPLDRGSKPTMLFNAKINPLIPYAMRGAIWYQGEYNRGEGSSYMHKMRALVAGWRTLWDQGAFPFYFVQLANYRDPGDNPEGGDGWARIRMAQLKSLDIENTGMAVAIELADEDNPGDIHPKNKKDVGERLALWALAKDYGKKIAYSGPLYRSMQVTGREAIIHFDHVDEGLMVGEKSGLEPVKEVQDGTLKQFAISGEDGQWHWADAEIEGKTVVVSSEAVEKPVAVRYAYTMNPDGCNLYNKAGLPASPFTTDEHWR